MCNIPEFFGEPLLTQREEALYEPLEAYLHHGFHELHKPKYGSLHLVTARTDQAAGPLGGTWTQPDLAAVGVSRSRFATTADIRLFSFEVKTRQGCTLQSVHEALAHTRFVNISYLVWNRPKCICDDAHSYETIRSNCAAYGVGLITIHNPKNLNTFEVRLQAQARTIPADEIDEFISTRFDEHKQNLILQALKRFGQGP